MVETLKNAYELGRFVCLYKILKIIRKILASNFGIQKLNIVDLGCGDLRYLKLIKKIIPSKELWAVDIKIQETTKEYYDIIFLKEDLERKTSLPSNYFHLVIALEILEHLSNFDNLINESYRILRNNGILLLSSPNARSLEALKYKIIYRRKWDAGDKTHVQLFSYKDLLRMINTKFTVLNVFGYKFFTLKNVLLPFEINLMVCKLFYPILIDTIVIARKR